MTGFDAIYEGDGAPDARPYDGLSPELVLDAVETLGLAVDGRLLSLNSYENRVYQVGIEGAPAVVAKFYRPGRWSDAGILEEHRFAALLSEREIPVVAPLRFERQTLFRHAGFRFALFPRQGGREPVMESDENLAWMGRLLGRIHGAGQGLSFRHRPRILELARVEGATRFLLDGSLLPAEQRPHYEAVTALLVPLIGARFAAAGDCRQRSIHGDCHRGNVLWTDSGPHLVDLDDCLTGPAVQDIWMLLDGDPDTGRRQLAALLEGYEQFMEFDPRELKLVEALRAQRMIEYAAWIARRWDDPAFPRIFPWFSQARYWEDHIASLKEQAEALQAPPPDFESMI